MVKLFHAVSYGELPSRGGQYNVVGAGLTVSANGSMLGTGFYDSYSPGSCTPDQQMQHQCNYGTNLSGQLFTNSGEKTYSSGPIFSRNGRYLYACNPGCLLYDLTLGTSQAVPLSVAGIANNGTVCGAASANPAIWTSQSGVQAIAQLAPSLSNITLAGGCIDSTGSRVVIGTFSPDSPSETRLYIVEISSGLVSPLPVGHQFLQFSDSGSTIALLGKDAASMTQVFLVNADGSMVRQATSEPSGIGSAAISGDGSVVIAADGNGEVLRFDVNAGSRDVLFETGPQMNSSTNPTVPGAAPGSLVEIDGNTLSTASAIAPPGAPLPTSLGGIRVILDGVPLPILAVRPSSVRFQLPWQLSIAVHQIQVIRPIRSPFAPGVLYFAAVPADLRFLNSGLFQVDPPAGGNSYVEGDPTGPSQPPVVFHQDWSPVSDKSPAVVGEILHFYVTGLGAVAGNIADGETTPGSALLPVTQAPVFSSSVAPGANVDSCSAFGAEFELMFAGLAPGTVGVYQLDLKLSSVNYAGPVVLSCSVSPYGPLSSSVVLFAAPQAGATASEFRAAPLAARRSN